MHLVFACVLQLPTPITIADWDVFIVDHEAMAVLNSCEVDEQTKTRSFRPAPFHMHRTKIPNSCLFASPFLVLSQDSYKRLQVCLVSSAFCARLTTNRSESCFCWMPEQFWVHSTKDAPQLQLYFVLSKKRQLFSWLETWWCNGSTLHLNATQPTHPPASACHRASTSRRYQNHVPS